SSGLYRFLAIAVLLDVKDIPQVGPLQWGRITLWRLGERETGTTKLEEAIAAYREALKERTRGRTPREWAVTQNNLGIALFRLGERESGTRKLEEAIAAYREALKEHTPERYPLDWAGTLGNEGLALMLLSERRQDAPMAGGAPHLPHQPERRI